MVLSVNAKLHLVDKAKFQDHTNIKMDVRTAKQFRFRSETKLLVRTKIGLLARSNGAALLARTQEMNKQSQIHSTQPPREIPNHINETAAAKRSAFWI